MCTVPLISVQAYTLAARHEAPPKRPQNAAVPVRTLCVSDTAGAVTGGHGPTPDFAKALVSGL